MKPLKEMVGQAIGKNCECGASFVVRQNSNDLGFFLGCSKYPQCTGTSEIPEELLMREAGQASFFDRPPKDWPPKETE